MRDLLIQGLVKWSCGIPQPLNILNLPRYSRSNDLLWVSPQYDLVRIYDSFRPSVCLSLCCKPTVRLNISQLGRAVEKFVFLCSLLSNLHVLLLITAALFSSCIEKYVTHLWTPSVSKLASAISSLFLFCHKHLKMQCNLYCNRCLYNLFLYNST